MNVETIQHDAVVITAFLSERFDPQRGEIHTVEAMGIRVEAKKNSIPKLCRELIAKGHQPSILIEFVRCKEDGGVIKCLTAAPLSWWADRSLAENDKGFQVTRYRPFEGPEVR